MSSVQLDTNKEREDIAHHFDDRQKDQGQFKQRLSPLRITAIYLIIGALWILLSDRLLATLVTDPEVFARLGTVKGCFYVLVTTALLYILIQRAGEALERRVEECTRELSTLLAISHTVVSTLELKPLLNLILEQLQNVVDYARASVLIREREELLLRTQRGAFPHAKASEWRPWMQQSLAREVILNQDTIVIHDTMGDAPPARDFRAWANEYASAHSDIALDDILRDIRSWMGVPLIVKGQVIGMLTLSYPQVNHFSHQDALLVKAFADQVAVTIENAQLYEQARRRLAEIESLQRVTAALLQKLTLEETLDVVCQEACQLTGAQGGALFALEDEAWLRVVHSVGTLKLSTTQMPLENTFTGRAIQRGEPLLLNDPEKLARSRHLVPDLESLLVIPMQIEGPVVGALDVVNKPDGFTQDDVRILSLFADGAALAIERAVLYQQTEQLAVVEERQRLSRELHDSVTQALYSMNLYAEAARRAIEFGRQDAALKNVEEVRKMAREAIVDMRLLIFELRPPVLEEAGLAAALQMRLDSVETRAGLQTEIQVQGDQRLPPTVEEELFWIAQEALNNVVRHARAGRVTVRLQFDDEVIRLQVQDDGSGFEPAQAVQSGGLGLRSMQERAARIAGELDIDSIPGAGTTIGVKIKIPHTRKEER